MTSFELGPPDRMLLGRLRDVFTLDEGTIGRTLHPDFYRYFRPLFGNPRAFDAHVADVAYLAREGGLSGQVLDVAAGFGLVGLTLRALGTERVDGVDIVETKVATARRLAALVGADACRFELGDAAALSAADASADGVLVKDAASHFRSPARAFSEMARVLRPGGRLVIIDDRNARNPRLRRETRAIWEASESGSSEELAALGLRTPFTEMRRSHVARRFPDLDDATIRRIAERTRGCTFDMLDVLVPTLARDASAAFEPVAPCIDPESGIAQERLIDPFELVSDLARAGLDARLLPTAGWDPETFRQKGGGGLRLALRRVAWGAWPAVRGWHVVVSRVQGFVIVARKR